MPYYVHTIGASPEDITRSQAYETKQSALNDRIDGLTVSFIASEDEQIAWHEREQSRFDCGKYIKVPWYSCDIPLASFHYAHISLSDPGKVAYTPSDEYGIADRQNRVRPGRYLQQFAADVLSAEVIERYTVSVRAFTGKLQLSTSADEICAIYASGESSCMGRKPVSFFNGRTGGVHPVEAYGDSPSLAVAYLGTPQASIARCVVWPAKQVYTRTYGDSALTSVLQASGYVYGNLDGAKIRAIPIDGDEDNDLYLMPYVDGALSAKLDGDYFTLLNRSNGGYDVRVQTGICGSGSSDSDEDEPYYTCSNCDTQIDEDEMYCESCNDSHETCESCESETFNNDFTRIGDSSYCDDCVNGMRSTCIACDNHWYTIRISSRQSRRYDEDGDIQLRCEALQAFIERGMEEFCTDCAEDKVYCYECSELSDDDAVKCEHCDHAFRDEDTIELPLEPAVEPATLTAILSADGTVTEVINE